MKKTLTINISGTIFHIDEDAYEKLQDYLHKLNNHYGNSSEGREIIADIELRIAEIFNETLYGSQVVTIAMVTDVISTMGTPEDIFEEDDEYTEKTTSEPYTQKIRRRLYRDPDHRILGGVNSGLANYLGIDVVIIRLIFLVLLFVYGVGFLPYIILWIVVPKARTTSQKLEMHGKKVNISNIEDTIKEEYQEVKQSLNNLRNKHGKTTEDGFDRIIDFLGVTIRLVLKIIVIILGIGLLIGGISSLIAFVFGISVSPIHFFSDISSELFLSGWTFTLFVIGISIVVIIPILLIIFAGLKLLLNFKTNNRAIWLSALFLWILGLMLIITIGIKQGLSYKYHISTPTVTNTLKQMPTDTIYLKTVDNVNYDTEVGDVHLNSIRMVVKNDDEIIIGKPTLNIKCSNSDNLEIALRRKAWGASRETAKEFAYNINYQWYQEDNALNFNQFFTLRDDDKWQNQRILLTLNIPVGKIIYLDNSMESILNEVDNVDGIWEYDMLGKYWIMTEKGLKEVMKK